MLKRFSIDMFSLLAANLRRLSVCLVLTISLSINAEVRAGDYSDGLKAYLANDYESARTYWLKGAKSNDAKSMFNLGLLHEQRKIARADITKAEKWYRMAGKNGYGAADYHLANRLLTNGSGVHSEVKALLERASNNGYAPAKVRLENISGRTVSAVISEPQASNANGSSVNSGEVDAGQRYQTEGWINQKRRNHWTIQVLAFNNEQKVQAFIDDHGLSRQAAYFSEGSSDGILYKLVYGVYDSKDKADFARQNLSGDLKQHGPWLRTIASVQEAIKSR